MERAAALSAGAPLDAALFESLDAMGWSPAPGTATVRGFNIDEPLPLKEAKRRMELAYIERQVALSGGSITQAAERLAVLPNNLSRRLGELRSGAGLEELDSLPAPGTLVNPGQRRVL
jgi:DNA-binding NtrC family response regulator